jgi:4-amino-4-deoxy-L-arabinose transferase-like glycosyltransferase
VGIGVAIAAWILTAAALSAWLVRTPGPFLREQLKAWQFWSLEICVVVGVVLGAGILREMWRGLDRRDVLGLVGLAAVAVALTVLVAPRTNRIYYDEQIYQGIGQNLADSKLAQMCNDGTVEYGWLQCWHGEYNKQPYAYPHLLSLAYRTFGVGPETAFLVNAIVMGLTACALYLLVFVLFQDRVAALFAGLLIALTPQQILWSATAAVEPSASLACVGALLAAAQFSRSRSTVALAGVAVATAYAIQFRPESFLIVPVVGLLLWPGLRQELGTPRLWWIGLLLLALLAVHVAHMYAVRGEGWGTTDARLSLRYVLPNLSVNGGFYLGDRRFPLLFTLLALVGLGGQRFSAERTAVVTYFVLFFGIFLLFYAGSYDYGADVRYSLMTYPPVAALGGLGAARVVGWLERVVPVTVARAGLVAALAIQFSWYAPLVRATTEEAWAARADVRFARSLVPDLRGNAYVLTHNPGMFHVWGINAGQMSLALTNPTYLEYLTARYKKGVYLHWNFWCNVQDPVQQEFCRKALAMTTFEAVREYWERDQRFAFYRVVGPVQRK